MTKKLKKGQIVLFVIIILLISIIIVTSVVSRTLTGIKTSTINTDSTRAFNAAESGMEELLSRSSSDLANLAHQGPTPIDIKSVNPSTFSEIKYQAEALAYETPDIMAKDSLLQFDFSGTPTGNLTVNFNDPACVLISAISTTGNVVRTLTCSNDKPNFEGEAWSSETCSPYNGCTANIATIGTLRTVIIKILNSSTKIRIVASDYSTFDTIFIKGTSWATTKSGVKKEIEVVTKTTKDIFPVFDYALYIK